MNITFTGELNKYTKTFNKIQRSDYGTGCDSFIKIIKYRGDLCYIPEENECFRKCLEYISKNDLSKEHRDFIKESRKNMNLITAAKIQPFCKKYNINLGVYKKDQRTILLKLLKERRICLYTYKNQFCLIWKTMNTTFTDAIRELEANFEYEANHISEDILKQVAGHKFPISNEKDCLYGVFSLDLETVNVPCDEFCEANAAGDYHLNRLKNGTVVI